MWAMKRDNFTPHLKILDADRWVASEAISQSISEVVKMTLIESCRLMVLVIGRGYYWGIPSRSQNLILCLPDARHVLCNEL